MIGFNINLDLSLYFDDLRKFSSVFVNLSKCKSVGDVEQHIKWLFRLENDICLVHDKFLLPKLEDAQLFHQCGTIQVQNCGFINDKNDKKEEEKCLSNNLALNLTQIEKTVDLSCKPKQRLKTNLNKSYCKSSAISSYVDNNEIEMVNQSFCSDEISKSHSKDKHKRKKKSNKIESINQDCNDNTGSDILDMSVNKVLKTSHDNCFLPAEDKKLICEGEEKISIKRTKKRKRQPDFLDAEFNVLNSIEPSASNELISKKTKKCFKKACLDNKETLTQETSHGLDIFCKSEDVLENYSKRANNLKCFDEHSKTYTATTRKDSKNLQFEKKDPQQIQTNCYSNVEFKNCNLLESECDSENRLSERKKLYQNHIDTLLANNTNFSSTRVFSESGGSVSSNYAVVIGKNQDLNNSAFNNHVLSQNEDQTSRSGEQSVQSNLECSNTKVRRKRVRKHRKNKKPQYLETVGHVLQTLTAQNEVVPYKSSTPSTTAKHIYFGDTDCNEETMADTFTSSNLETSTQGFCGINNLNTSQELPSKECPNWQEELLKLASAPKPIIFQRFGTPKINLHSTSSHSQGLTSQSPDKTNQNGPCTSLCTTEYGNVNHEDVKSCDLEENLNKVENLRAHDGAIPSEKFKDPIKLISTDLRSIKLSNYPVIDKVVAEDLILFQLLKLNENYEPDVSKVILAKVKCVTNFPDKLSLEIIEGSGDCELLTRADTGSDKTIVELSWKDLVEPRIFFP